MLKPIFYTWVVIPFACYGVLPPFLKPKPNTIARKEVSEEGSRRVLNARVLACQSFITPGKASICEAQTLGISLIEDNRQDEAIASLEVIGKNGGILEMRTPQTTLV